MLVRLGVLLRLAFPVELALAFTAGIFFLGFLTAVSAATPPARPTQPQRAIIATATPSPTTASNAASGANVVAADTATITMAAQGASFAFAPANLTVHVGTNVIWQNTSTVPHTVVGPGFDSAVLMPGHSFTHTFTQTGTFAYTCTIHPGMSGAISVVP